MSKFITSSVDWLEYLLAMPVSRRGTYWPHEVCTATRYIHIDVWADEIEKDIVETDVLPVMNQAVTKLRALREQEGCGGYIPEHLDTFIRNDKLRIKNIVDNYMHDKPSAFLPEAILKELLKMAG